MISRTALHCLRITQGMNLKYTPCLATRSELWGVYIEYVEKINRVITALYSVFNNTAFCVLSSAANGWVQHSTWPQCRSPVGRELQNGSRIINTSCVVLCFGVNCYQSVYSFPSGLVRWHCDQSYDGQCQWSIRLDYGPIIHVNLVKHIIDPQQNKAKQKHVHS